MEIGERASQLRKKIMLFRQVLSGKVIELHPLTAISCRIAEYNS